MRIRQCPIDAFAARVFEGKPAPLFPLQTWLDHREPFAAAALPVIEAEMPAAHQA